MEVKSEADYNIAECSHNDKPTVGTFNCFDAVFINRLFVCTCYICYSL